ncbi:hypothetical protein CEXT_206891 [Caerostris extrusa]|uniref:Uncharacterized protein n=1 Tax=Caerostris extrusa TaxID=172846 RepID=A0AAV4XLY0_CAEEX|nr:hypothetical protein CEXT_206891 [Caerostris extrusa]
MDLDREQNVKRVLLQELFMLAVWQQHHQQQQQQEKESTRVLFTSGARFECLNTPRSQNGIVTYARNHKKPQVNRLDFSMNKSN